MFTSISDFIAKVSDSLCSRWIIISIESSLSLDSIRDEFANDLKFVVCEGDRSIVVLVFADDQLTLSSRHIIGEKALVYVSIGHFKLAFSLALTLHIVTVVLLTIREHLFDLSPWKILTPLSLNGLTVREHKFSLTFTSAVDDMTSVDISVLVDKLSFAMWDSALKVSLV